MKPLSIQLPSCGEPPLNLYKGIAEPGNLPNATGAKSCPCGTAIVTTGKTSCFFVDQDVDASQGSFWCPCLVYPGIAYTDLGLDHSVGHLV